MMTWLSTLRAVQRHGSPLEKRALGGALLFGMFAIGVAVKTAAALAGYEPLGAADNPGLVRLARAVGEQRVIRPRLTGGFAHAPCEESGNAERLITGLVCRSSLSESPSAPKLARLAAAMRSRRTEDHSSNNHHTLGVWNLLWPDVEGSVEKAVASLQAAAERAPRNAAVQSDLAAALLAKAESSDDPRPIFEAYAAADSALALDASLTEAYFNRAIGLEWLYLQEDAIDAWNTYLSVDDQTRWADEARGHLARLTLQPPDWDENLVHLRRAETNTDTSKVTVIVRQFPSDVRREIYDALAAWARARSVGSDLHTDKLLRDTGSLARALQEVTGNTLPLEAIAEVERASSRADTERLSELAVGHEALGRGRQHIAAFQLDSAHYWSTLSVQAFQRSGSPVYLWALYDLAHVSYQRADPRGYDRALNLLTTVRRQARQHHTVLKGMAARTTGLIQHIRAEYDLAMRAYSAAIEEGRLTGEPELLLRTRPWLASIQSALRGELVAWRELYAALKLTTRYPYAFNSRHSTFTIAAEQLRESAPKVAVLLHGNAVRAASAWNQPGAVAGALAKRAELLLRDGKRSAALEDLKAARRFADSVTNDTTRASLYADADVVLGQAMLSHDPDSAVLVINQAVRQYRQTDYYDELDRALLALANAYVAAGRSDSAQLSFESAIEETERQRSRITDYQDRAQFLDNARPVIDHVLGFYADRGDTTEAFDFLERMRARVLLERTHSARSAATSPLTFEVIRTRLPERVNLITYAVLKEEILVWIVQHGGIRMRRVPLPALQLRQHVSRLNSLMLQASSSRELEQVSSVLWTKLVEPIADFIQPNARLVFLPDKWLHFVPFAALWDSEKQRYLVQSHEISVAPSAALYIQAIERYAGLQSTRAQRVLAIGNPAFDRRMFPLADLPGAELEAAEVADAYGQAKLLTGRAATKEAFVSNATTFDVIHFAGHAVVRTDAPLLSHMLLAPREDGSDGIPYARDLFELNLTGPRLVILSGCHTSGGRLSSTEGASSLARAFFAAGVPAVIASLWAVEDEETRKFFGAYHRRLALGGNPVVALRDTQVEWIESSFSQRRPAPVSTWAAFQLFGAAPLE